MDYQGYYINLARSTTRDTAMRQHLATLKLSHLYERFEAVLGSAVAAQYNTKLPPGQLGCWLSHLELWKRCRGSKPHIHILEDDALMHPLMHPILSQIPDMESWDLLFTDVYFHPPPAPDKFITLRENYRSFHQRNNITLADLLEIPFTGTTSYLVNSRSLDKLIGLMDRQWETNVTIDVQLQKLVRERKLRAFVTIPFLSTLHELNEDSTAGGQGINLRVLNEFRASFYVNSDIPGGYQRMLRENQTLTTEPHLGMYLELLRQVLGTIQF